MIYVEHKNVFLVHILHHNTLNIKTYIYIYIYTPDAVVQGRQSWGKNLYWSIGLKPGDTFGFN